MAFDQSTRNRLARFVGDARALLTEEFTRQLQHEYGMDPTTGEVTGIDRLTALDDSRRETARVLRETMEYYLAGRSGSDLRARRDVLDRIVREQSFTVLNRLCALRMAEARGFVLETIAKGYQSKGFQLYARLAGTALGETGDAYRCYLFSLFDEFAVDLPVLFDRFSPQGRLFPREAGLLRLLQAVNHPEIDSLWAEDETIGWIYQYFNSKEERKAMRDASQAPRNSRELAVRNQFFTPRYVVEFLTDNTLGRVWYEMTRGETALKDSCSYLVRRATEIFLNNGEETPAQQQPIDELSQEQLLHQPVFIPHRPLKDPREIKMLDPACGSMHFGLYAFDLYERIYDEAWDLEEKLGADAFTRSSAQSSLHESYDSNREAFLRDVPRLIIESNIHGIDIDPRAVQIAGLSLWLRAQKSWQSRGLKAQERPAIHRSNIVCAEPMPGDRAQLEEFLTTLREDHLQSLLRKVLRVPAGHKVRATRAMGDALAGLVRTVWQEMELAGEAGSLLKIEETLQEAIAKARVESEERAPLFRVLEYGLNEPPTEQYVRVVPGEAEDFWNRAEILVLGALQEYAEQAENDGGFRRRLYAGDAVRGFSFIDICRQYYDITLMNPPFGLATDSVFDKLRTDSPDTFTELYASFVQRAILWTPSGFVGAITSRGFFTMTRLTQWRRNAFIPNAVLVYDLGLNVMDDAFVGSSAYILSNNAASVPLLIIDAGRANDRASLGRSVNWSSIDDLEAGKLFFRERGHFLKLPESKFLYKAGPEIVSLFSNCPKFEGVGGEVRTGLTTFDDVRFLRLLWEIPLLDLGQDKSWQLFSKGGEYAKYYTDLHLVVNRSDDGRELAEVNVNTNGQVAQSRQGSTYYYRPGLTYTSRSGRGISVRSLPSGCVISHNAPTIYPLKETSNNYLLGWANSRLIKTLIEIQASANYYTPGSAKMVPWIDPDRSSCAAIEKYMLTLIADYVYPSFFDETSPVFTCIKVGPSLGNVSKTLSEEFRERAAQIRQSQAAISDLVDRLYGINSRTLSSELLDIEPDNDIPITSQSLEDLAVSTVGYALGCVYGRWNIMLVAQGEKLPTSFDPFAPMPICQPAMLQDELGLPTAPEHILPDYPLQISCNGILTDDEGHRRDLIKHIEEVFHIVWKENAETTEQEACKILGIRTLREYFRKPSGFFADHLKCYSKSRRQAPLYWPLSTPSCSYSLWLYYHRLTDQTLFTCVNDFVDPKLQQVTEEAVHLRQKKGRSTDEEKELERLTDFERELRDFREELLRVAKFWKPNLNDGVEITAAPLWKLFQHKPWQKRLRETWRKLEAGEYDWAHLAYSIWPDRVQKKCETDKSFAIAHSLEHLYKEPKVPPKKRLSKKQDQEPEEWDDDD